MTLILSFAKETEDGCTTESLTFEGDLQEFVNLIANVNEFTRTDLYQRLADKCMEMGDIE